MKMRRGQSRQGDFHINIVPIIDCLTILITFMLASGVYLSIGLLKIGIAAPGEEATQDFKIDPISLNIHMNLDHSFLIKTKASAPEELKIDSKKNYWNLKEFDYELKEIKSRIHNIDQITLIADKEISYQYVIEAMSMIKKVYRKKHVQLGGF